jgi:uncharacterized membrane protein YhaH (DUF805 family)
MTFVESLRHCLTIKYCSVQGRASRSEYWWFLLFATVASSVLERLSDGGGSLALIAGLASLALFLPQVCVTARRLHDIGWSGWWQLLPLVLVFAGIASFLFDASGLLCAAGILGGFGFGFYFGLRKGTAPGEPNPYGGAPDSFDAPSRPVKSAPAQVEDFVLEEDTPPAACPNCGKPFAEGNRFCGHCGHAWPSVPKCPSCGRELTDDSRFCTQCGAKLKD